MAAFVSSKWDGLFGLAALWFVTAACFAQQLIVGLRSAQPNRSRQAAVGGGSGRFAWGNPFGVRLPFFVCSTIFSILVIYVLTYVPNWSGAISTGTSTIGHAGFAGLLSLQYQMYHYHATLNATHLYSSKWWTWPFALRPVSYYYTTISGTTPPNEVVSEIVGLPNPIVWWAGLISVPWAAVLAWRERHKGVALLIVAYFAQWLPWALSPRIDFLYNFYPNLAIICLSSAYVLLHIWKSGKEKAALAPKLVAGGYLAACIVFFIYFLPIWDADHISWTAWINRMWIQGPIVHGWI
jgi:hypothetical protein